MDSISKNEFNQAMTRIDQRLQNVDKRFDAVDRRFSMIDKRFEAVDQRFDTLESRLAAMTVRWETKIEEEVGGLAAMIQKGFADLEKRLDVKERVEALEKKMAKVETAINVTL